MSVFIYACLRLCEFVLPNANTGFHFGYVYVCTSAYLYIHVRLIYVFVFGEEGRRSVRRGRGSTCSSFPARGEMTPSAFRRNFSAFPTLVYRVRGLVSQNFVAFLVLLFLISGDDMEASLANTRIRLLRGFGGGVEREREGRGL